MNVRDLVEAFIRWNREHRSAATVKQYTIRLRSFVSRFADRDLNDLRPLEIEEWLSAEARFPDGTEKAPDTRRQTIIAFERLQSWSIERRELRERIIDRIEKPRGRQRDRLPTEEETAKILQHASPEFALVYQSLRACGARPNELARATIADLAREPGCLVLEKHKTARKTGRPRRIVIGRRFRELLNQALVDHGVQLNDDGHLSAIAGDVAGQPIYRTPRRKAWTSDTLGATFRRLRTRVGLPADLVLYLTRHEHGTKVCDKLGIHAASEALGHANLQTTKRYVHTDTETLRSNQDAIEL